MDKEFLWGCNVAKISKMVDHWTDWTRLLQLAWQTYRMNQIYKMNTQANFLTGIGLINQAESLLQEGNMNFGSIRPSQFQQAINEVIHAMTPQEQKNVES